MFNYAHKTRCTMPMVTIKSFRQSGNRRLSFIPTLCTLANALFGFLAVIKALEGDFLTAAYCIFCAAFMDMIDGRIARFFGLATAFGMELDSLCDAVSFCFVPVIVLYCWSFHTQGFLGVFILAFYLWCGLFRLARFNSVTSADAKYFIGLPTTIAALCLASLLAYMPSIDVQSAQVTIDCSMIIVGTLSFLMISTLRFPGCKRLPKSNSLSFGIITMVSLIGYAALCAWPLKLVVPFGYVVVSSVSDIYQRLRYRWHS